MKLIKLYEEFWGKKKNESDDLEFDFLAAVGRLKQAINKTIDIHEKHYYNDSKIVNSEEFQSELKSNIDKIISSDGLRTLMTEDFCDLVHKFESSLYNDNKFGIDSGYDYSMFGIFDDLISSLRSAVSEKNERSISFLDKESQHVLDRCDDSWVYIENEESPKMSMDFDMDEEDFEKTLSDFENDDQDDTFEKWQTAEGLQADLENYIGKKVEDFEYADKLQAYNYVESNETIQNILNNGQEEEVEQLTNFLNSIKEFFGL
jgi:hypothetical protein